MQCSGTDASLKFLDSVKELVKEDNAASKEAWLLLELERAQYELDAKSPAKLTAAKEKIDKASELMDTLAGLKDIVHSALYRLKLQYHKVRRIFGQKRASSRVTQAMNEPLQGVINPQKIQE